MKISAWFKRAQIGMLPVGRLSVGAARHSSRIVVDARDLAARGQSRSRERYEIEPLVRGAAKGSVVQIEAVDIDNRFGHA